MKKAILFLFSFTFVCVAWTQVSVVKPNIYPYDFVAELKGKIIFFSSTEAEPYNVEVWSSDGTDAGTELLKDINGTADGSICSNSYWGPNYNDRMPVVYNNELYFLATDGPHGVEIWKTDGTSAGTTMLKDIHPGAQGYFDPQFNYPYFTELDGELYFAANDGSHGFELWKSDGTEGGTEMVKDISADGIYGSNPEHLINFNGTLIFTARDDVYGYEIYKSDGTEAGTELIKDIVPGIYGSMNDGYAGSIDPQFTVSGDYLYFTGRIDETLPVYFYLYRTDGTDAGTITLNNDLQNVANFCDVDGTCYFYGFDGDYDHSSLWKTDGTIAGTTLISNAANLNASNLAHSFYNFNNQLYFYSFTSDLTSIGLGKTNGTDAGTTMITTFEGLGSIPDVYDFNRDGSSPYFFYHALKKISESAMSIRLVQTNGTTAGTEVFPGVQPFRSTAFLDGDIYFAGIDSTADEVWGLYKVHPLDLGVGIESIGVENELILQPNPASSNIIIQIPELTGNAEISIFDLNGRKVFSRQNNNSTEIRIDVSEFNNGIYFLRLADINNRFTTKFIVQH